ncbi:MAG: hypothetical protein ACOVP4_11550 [Bacteriovoracaceae bacterium]
MLKLFVLPLLLTSCAHLSSDTSPEGPLVTVHTALNQAQSSYLRGCVEAYQSLRLGPTYFYCLENARKHRLELQMIMDTPVEMPLAP